MSKDSAEEAAQAQGDSSAAAIAEQRRQFDLNRSDLAPWRDTGTAAQRRLAVLLGLSPTSAGPRSIEQEIGARPQREQFMRAGGSTGGGGGKWVTPPGLGPGQEGFVPGSPYVLGAGVPQNPGGNDLSGTYFGTDDMGNPIYSGFRGQPGGVPTGGGVTQEFDEAAYNAAVSDYETKKAAFDAAGGPAKEAGYGDLLRKFSLSDLDADPLLGATPEENRIDVQRRFAASDLEADPVLGQEGEQSRLTKWARDNGYTVPAQGQKWTEQEIANLYAGGAPRPPEPVDVTRRFATSDLEADPVYQSGLKFGADQGRDAINARAIQAGGYDSGATLKALTRFGNDYGSTKANESFNRYNTDMDRIYGKRADSYNRYNTDMGNIYNRRADSYNRYTADNTNIYNKLAGVSGSGQTAANTTAASGTNMANNVSELITGAGNARAAGIVGGANAMSGAATGITNAANNWQSNQTLQALLKNRNSYGGSTSQPDFSAGYYSEGGVVRGPGTPTSDSIPIRVSDGEYVIPADVVKKKGVKFFQKLMADNRAH